ncbi:MAG: aldose 1-epimerase [Phycisphaerales bacterium]|nr:aldose 1-epimerase [Phycisphaerales bacterium]
MSSTPPPYDAIKTTRDGVELLELVCNHTNTCVSICPAAGMCVVGMTVAEKEYVHLPLPLGEFVASQHTGGIPLLYPWANRLRSDHYEVNGQAVNLADHALVHRDGNGLPMHGLLVRFDQWKIDSLTATDKSADLHCHIDWAEHEALMAAFPFEHRLSLAMSLKKQTLAIEVTVTPTSKNSVPISFGWHPYLKLAGSKRDDWKMTTPSLKQVTLDAQNLPVHPLSEKPAPDFSGEFALRGHQFDDLFAGMGDDSTAHMSGPDSSIMVAFKHHYQWMQIFSPTDASYCCVEPMTSLTAQLSDNPTGLPQAQPAAPWSARFEISVNKTDV